MFRVLSEKETEKVTRWQAPEFGASSEAIVRTRQQSSPQIPDGDAHVRTLLGSTDLKPGSNKGQVANSQSTPVGLVDVLASRGHQSGDGGNISVSADMLQSSYDEGYAAGYDKASTELRQQSGNELRAVINALSDAAGRHNDADFEQELIALSLDIARLVIRREITVAPQIMHDIVTSGLEQLAENAREQCVYMNPLDASIVRNEMSSESSVRILDDHSLEPGACRIEAGASVVSAGVEDWLNTVSVQLGLVQDEDVSMVDAESSLPE